MVLANEFSRERCRSAIWNEEWRRIQSSANPSQPDFPAIREFFREFAGLTEQISRERPFYADFLRLAPESRCNRAGNFLKISREFCLAYRELLSEARGPHLRHQT